MNEEIKKKLADNFKLFDQNGDGVINFNILKDLMNKCDLFCTEEELQDLVNEVDINEKGQIDYKNFIKIANKKLTNFDTEEDLREFFNRIDKNKKGYVTPQNLFDVFSKIDENLKEEEVIQMVKENDLDLDGFLNYEEFCRMVKNK